MLSILRATVMKPIVLEHREHPLLLVLEDVEETALLMKKMLIRSGYCVSLARDEHDAIARARVEAPNLILMNLGIERDQLVAAAHRIREQSGNREEIPIVIFANLETPERAEIKVGKNIYLTSPDDFNQLRELLHRLAWNGPGQ